MKQETKDRSKYNKRNFLIVFCIAIALIAVVRHVCSIEVPDIMANKHCAQATLDSLSFLLAQTEPEESVLPDDIESEDIEDVDIEPTDSLLLADTLQGNGMIDTGIIRNKVIGVYSFDKCFPDINEVQLAAAQHNGIIPVHTREEAQQLVRSNKLVNITNSPFYTVDDLSHSMPYLVPKAQHLLNTISVNFIDSLRSKGMPPHLLMVTSVLRTGSDVKRLQRGNVNATTNSCHCYGTTVDIAYNRFVPVVGHYNDDARHLTRWDFEMKLVLSEVLNDLRKRELCYVKYEKKQGCFHLTVR
ncbi:MAG: DUF5715 family protein [Bacteroides sp.]|nr:DUF5715 family protein [Roseburia sp.]MCM1346052.1 DUF5715 family protein [Bacteroides sp.]MCM1420214.1 DUF5715 family protein [Bacteroides sp.]